MGSGPTCIRTGASTPTSAGVEPAAATDGCASGWGPATGPGGGPGVGAGRRDVELFLSQAGIAGVFVGFGALISVRSGGPSGVDEVSSIRWVVSLAIWVVIAALAPVIVNRYAIAGHGLWLVCSLLALVLFVVVVATNGRAPETVAGRTAAAAALSRATPRATAMLVVQAGTAVWLPMVSIILALVLVVLGPFPGQEQAIYLTAVSVGLFGAALTLLALVFVQPYPAMASDPAALPATGGSSA